MFIGEQLEEKFGKIAEECMVHYNNIPYVTGSITGITSKKVVKTLLYEVEFSWTGFSSTTVDYKCIPSAIDMGKKLFQRQEGAVRNSMKKDILHNM